MSKLQKEKKFLQYEKCIICTWHAIAVSYKLQLEAFVSTSIRPCYIICQLAFVRGLESYVLDLKYHTMFAKMHIYAPEQVKNKF